MTNLYARLIEVCRDQGYKDPIRKVTIAKVAGLSGGRVTQIRDEGEVAALGTKALSKLAMMGYSTAWLTEGKGAMRTIPREIPVHISVPPTLTENQQALLDAFAKLSPKAQALALADMEHLARRSEIESTHDDDLPKKRPASS